MNSFLKVIVIAVIFFNKTNSMHWLNNTIKYVSSSSSSHLLTPVKYGFNLGLASFSMALFEDHLFNKKNNDFSFLPTALSSFSSLYKGSLMVAPQHVRLPVAAASAYFNLQLWPFVYNLYRKIKN